jgi:hypothetical protein
MHWPTSFWKTEKPPEETCFQRWCGSDGLRCLFVIRVVSSGRVCR